MESFISLYGCVVVGGSKALSKSSSGISKGKREKGKKGRARRMDR